MDVGFIGTGSMGSILIEAFLHSGALCPERIIAHNRTTGKAAALAKNYPGLKLAGSNIEVVQNCHIAFICVKPLEFKRVIDEIKSAAAPSLIVVSITSPVLIQHLEEHLPYKIAKVIPSITNRMLDGSALCMYGSRITSSDRQLLEQLISQISKPVVISEDYARVASDISSCGPAFLAFFIQRLIEAAVEETGLPRHQAAGLAAQMALGTGKLLTEGGFSAEGLQQRVAVPGGITAEALRLLDKELAGVFNQLIRITHAKYHEDLEKVETLFANQPVDGPS